MTTVDPTVEQPAVLFTAALQELAETYPVDPEGTATVTVTVTDPATGKQHQALVQPGHLGWLTSTVMAEMATCRNGHADGNGQCGHCAGTGRAHDR
ncbi:hypothetical protein [Streptomyces sp. NPDC006134]|uniref:hypothetical protein n=1 Tax=Streptomyces sp. NPDC006134 TaxID=3154467 RepID=UPI0033DA912C